MSDTQTLADTVCGDIDAARGELVGLCDKLVAAPSVNPPGRTAEVAAVVRTLSFRTWLDDGNCQGR